ncbi:MAG TPA: class I SAM-dependent methyltransferase [Polyangiaceae bacterium]|jgi:predicted methyltransferase|nr:class I SAM-dependent methyltransferase [Polyangiaceae bacterium]
MRHLLLPMLCFACAPAEPANAPATSAQHGPGEPHGSHGPAGYHKDFSDAAGFSAHFDDPERDAWQRPSEVMARLRIPPGSVVVDLGAGTGYFIAALSRGVGPGGKVLALDVEPNMVEFLERRAHAEQLHNVEPKLVEPGDPKLTPHSVSRILIVNTWHHIDDRASYARRLAAGLAPGGEIWIVDFTPESDLGPPAHHRIPAAQVVGELEAAGLDAQVVEPEGLPKQYLVRAVARP